MPTVLLFIYIPSFIKWIKLSNIQFGRGVLVRLGCFNENTVDWGGYKQQ